MILHVDEREVEKVGISGESVDFNIKASPQAFRILANSLYSNKPAAIIRELVCNAWDAQMSNGNLDAPIDVHIPNYIEQWFSIRDYGPGILHDFMMGQVKEIAKNGDTLYVGYTTAFHSTKNDSNEAIGMMGIGRLSPLSYTDSYNTISITKDPKTGKNIKRIYVVCMDKGYPSINFVGEEETEEPTGFEVNCPIKEFTNFETEALKFLSNIDVKINLKGTSKTVQDRKIVLERKGWRAFETRIKGCYRSQSDYYVDSGTPFAKMGIVRYPISNSYMGRLANKSIEIDFNIGDLEITPSREALSYSPATIQAIESRIQTIEQEIIDEYSTQLNAAPNLWEARKLVSSLRSGELSRFSVLINDVAYNGKRIDSSIQIPKYTVEECYVFHRRGAERLYQKAVPCIKVNDHIVFCINDEIISDKGISNIKHKGLRIKKFLQNPDFDKAAGATFYIMTQAVWDNLKNSGDLDGAPEPIKLSELDYDSIIRVKKGEKKHFDAGEVYFVNENSTYPELWMGKNTFPDTGYYIPILARQKYQVRNYTNQLKHCRILGIDVDYVFGIHATKEKGFLRNYPKWQPADNLKKLIEEALDKRLKDAKVEEVSGEIVRVITYISSSEINHPKTNKIIKDFQNSRKNRDEELIALARQYGREIPVQSCITDQYNDLMTARPLLKLFESSGNSYRIGEFKDSIEEYLKEADYRCNSDEGSEYMIDDNMSEFMEYESEPETASF